MDTRAKITVVIPVYNEERNIAPLAAEVDAALTQRFDYELLYVDDASTDNTLVEIKELMKIYPNVTVISHQKNAGQSAAIITGVKMAKHPLIATLDGDGQNVAADICLLYTHWDSQQNLVCVGRRINREDNFIRRISSYIANTVRKTLLKDDCPDTGCGIKLFPKKLFLAIPHFRNCHRFLPALFKRQGATILNIPVSHRKRQHGTSKYGLGISRRLWVGIIDMLGVAWLMRRPLTVRLRGEDVEN